MPCPPILPKKHKRGNIMPSNRPAHRAVWTALLLILLSANAQDDVDGYFQIGRGSCQDSRGKMYSYLQRMMTFPNAETCARQECERHGGEYYRGFEFSVTKRCTCLFDVDEMPAVANDASDPTYIEKVDSGNGAIARVSGVSGTNCYVFGRNSAVTTAGIGGIHAAALMLIGGFLFLS